MFRRRATAGAMKVDEAAGPEGRRPRLSAKRVAAEAPSSRAASRTEPALTTPSKDILRQVKLLELRTRGLVNSLFVGEY
ncbi:MAG: hypothetical protein WD553_00410, partial [Gemmatimonadaceae bacterium]